MFHLLVSHNDDLRLLVEKGYAVAFESNYLIVRDIPYLGEDGQLKWGAIVAKVVFVDQQHVQQGDHQIYFAGAVPCGLDGKPIPNLGGGPQEIPLGDASKDVVVERSFSNKPTATGKFANFFEKIESYVAILCGPAMERYGVTPYTFRAVDEVAADSVFKLHDTLTSRAEITDLSAKFENDVVAVIGLGGTGAYVLDFLVRTPIREIRGFDADLYHVHNAFRSPGSVGSDFNKFKAEVYQERYETFRHGLKLEPKFIDASSANDLDGVTFAFVCVDKGSSRAGIFDVLLGAGIPFIDVGMGLKRKYDALDGMIRTTYYSVENAEALREKGLAELADPPNDLYRNNIQIGELNALNACLAVIRFKQVRGFYFEEAPLYNLVMHIGDLKIFTAADGDDN